MHSARKTPHGQVTCVKIVARIVETARVALAELDEAKDVMDLRRRFLLFCFKGSGQGVKPGS